jgi:arginase
MPAVDYRMPDGLHWNELVAILRLAIASGEALGIDVTIFNPKLDPSGAIAPRLVKALGDGLAAAASGSMQRVVQRTQG